MVTRIPPQPRKRSGRKAPDATLTLVSASYADGDALELTFDRRIDISALNGAAITVDDPVDYDLIYHGGPGATLLGPTKVRIPLVAFGNGVGGMVTLEATTRTGIRAVNDGGTWPGVAIVNLPYTA